MSYTFKVLDYFVLETLLKDFNSYLIPNINDVELKNCGNIESNQIVNNQNLLLKQF